MKAEHLEFLVEEPSAEAFLVELLPRLLDGRATFTIHAHQGKSDLIGKLAGRLRGYAKWLPEIARIVVLVDLDDNNCDALKQKMEQYAKTAGLRTRTSAGGAPWRVVNRIAIEELEAWFFGEWTAVRNAYPGVSKSIPRQPANRMSDGRRGGTWEAVERVVRNEGYFSGGLRKMEEASAIGKHFDPASAESPSFVVFWESVLDTVGYAQRHSGSS